MLILVERGHVARVSPKVFLTAYECCRSAGGVLSESWRECCRRAGVRVVGDMMSDLRSGLPAKEESSYMS